MTGGAEVVRPVKTWSSPEGWRRVPLPPSVRRLVAAHRDLVASYASTSLRFTLDGRLVGDIAEATAAEAFGLSLCKVRTAGVDAHTRDGRSVQVKSSGIGKGPAFTPGEGRAELLIFLMLDFERGEAHVRYNGPEAPVRALLPSTLIGTQRAPLARVLALDAEVLEAQRLKPTSVDGLNVAGDYLRSGPSMKGGPSDPPAPSRVAARTPPGNDVSPRRFGWFIPRPDGTMGVVAQDHVLTEAEFEEYANYTRVVNDLRAFVIDYHALQADFEALLDIEGRANVTLSTAISSKILDTPATVRTQAIAQRAVSNFLAAGSAFRDRGIVRQSGRGQAAVPTADELKTRISEIYDDSPAYRIACLLRNHAQHHENPISLTPIDANRTTAGTMDARMRLILSPQVLVDNRKLNAKARAELAREPADRPLLPILQSAMTAFQHIMLFILERNRERLREMAAYMAALFSAFRIPHDATPVIFDGFEPAAGPPARERCFLFGMDEMVDDFRMLEDLSAELAAD